MNRYISMPPQGNIIIPPKWGNVNRGVIVQNLCDMSVVALPTGEFLLALVVAAARPLSIRHKVVASVPQENHSRARMAVALPTGKLLLRQRGCRRPSLRGRPRFPSAGSPAGLPTQLIRLWQGTHHCICQLGVRLVLLAPQLATTLLPKFHPC